MHTGRTLRAITFDLDETLHDRTSSLARFAREQHARYALSSRVTLSDWCARLGVEGRVYQQLVSEFALPLSWQTLLEDYETSFPASATLFPDALQVLIYLRERGVSLGLITNGRSAFQRAVIAALGIGELFDAILISEEQGIRKPEQQIFLKALEKLGVGRDEIAHVGDRPGADILGARNAGLQAIWKRNGEQGSTCEPQADFTIAHLHELLSLPLLS